MNRLRIFAIAAALTAVALMAGAACGDDDDDTTTDTPAATSPAEASPTATASATGDDAAAVGEAADEVLSAIRDQDRDRIHDLTGDQLRQRIQDQDFDQLATCLPDGASIEMLSRTVETDGDSATVTVTLQVTDDSGTSQVERVWEFERQDDGTWALTELPDCPFQ